MAGYELPYPNSNIGGYIPPNRDLNQLDYVVSYRFKIIDVIK